MAPRKASTSSSSALVSNPRSTASPPRGDIPTPGTTGLLIAQGLKKSHIPFTIFESETPSTYQTRPREWGMTLHWGQSHIAACLPEDLVARFNEAYADPNQSPDAVTGLPIYNGKTGELIMEMGADKPCRVSRRKMRNLFAEGIDVQMGKTLVGASMAADDTVELTFADGSKATGSILVGCDGAKSRVRSAICGEETAKLTDVPVNMFNFPYKFDAELASKIRGMNELFQSAIHPDHGNMFWISSTSPSTCLSTLHIPFQISNTRIAQDIPTSTPTDPSTYTFQVLLSFLDETIPAGTDLSSQSGRMSFFKSRSSTFAEPWRSAAQAIDPSTWLPLDRGTYWAAATPWPNRAGHMTLAGDAAHPMTPHRGQGLNNALMDARGFVEAMIKVAEGGELEGVVKGYDEEVYTRGKEEMEVSLKQTMFIHNWETLMESPMVKIGMRQVREGDAKAN